MARSSTLLMRISISVRSITMGIACVGLLAVPIGARAGSSTPSGLAVYAPSRGQSVRLATAAVQVNAATRNHDVHTSDEVATPGPGAPVVSTDEPPTEPSTVAQICDALAASAEANDLPLMFFANLI